MVELQIQQKKMLLEGRNSSATESVIFILYDGY